MTVTELLKQRLANLQPTVLQIHDDSAAHANHKGNTGGAHLNLEIASEKFLGLTTIACHRLIYAQIEDLIPQSIHALSIKIIR